MRISIYIANKKYKASAYYRIVQYIDDMNIDCSTYVYEFFPNWYYEICKKINSKALKILLKSCMFIVGYTLRVICIIKNILLKEDEIVFIQGEIFLRRVPLGFKGLLEKYLKKVKRIIWDFDNNILKTKEISKFEFDILKEQSGLITVSHEGLKELVDDEFNEKIKVVKTTDKILEYINLYEVNKERLSYYNEKIVLLWIGMGSECKALKNIIPNLDNLAKRLKYKKLILKVISDNSLDIKGQNITIQNIRFSKKVAFKEILKSHIAIVPIEDNDELTESVYLNLIKYIGAGLPVVLSQNNMARDFIKNNNGYMAKDDSDFEKLSLYLTEKSIWKNKSNLSRKLWEEEFNSDNIRGILEGTFKL